MVWINAALTVYHGCADDDAKAIVASSGLPAAHSINLAKCKLGTDFARGFYTTTNLHQAKNWANVRVRRQRKRHPTKVATVVELLVDRERLAVALPSRPLPPYAGILCFVTEGASAASDYWNFVSYCRNGALDHAHSVNNMYDAVFGPVSLWPQTLVVKDCDQISFHSDDALRAIRRTNILLTGNPYF